MLRTLSLNMVNRLTNFEWKHVRHALAFRFYAFIKSVWLQWLGVLWLQFVGVHLRLLHGLPRQINLVSCGYSVDIGVCIFLVIWGDGRYIIWSLKWLNIGRFLSLVVKALFIDSVRGLSWASTYHESLTWYAFIQKLDAPFIIVELIIIISYLVLLEVLFIISVSERLLSILSPSTSGFLLLRAMGFATHLKWWIVWKLLLRVIILALIVVHFILDIFLLS